MWGNRAQQQSPPSQVQNTDGSTAASQQATKDAIAELYIQWSTLPNVRESLEDLVKDFLAASRHPRGEASSRHIDPAESDGSATPPTGQRRSPSPPGSPPITRLPANTRPTERTSPISANRSVIRVDELDTRSPSSGGAASPVSPNVASRSSENVVSEAGGLASISPTPPPEITNHHHIPQHHLSGRASGSNSGLAPPTVTAAGTNDIPLFYSRNVTEGSLDEAPSQQLWALRNAFALGTAGRASRGRAPDAITIDTHKSLRKDRFVDICTTVFELPNWLSDLLFKRILTHNNLPESSGLTYHDIYQYYDSTMARSTPNKRLFDLIKGDPRRNYCTQDDFRAAVRLLVEHHQGLDFLRQPEFQDFYCRTVAIRIIYELDLRQDRRVTWWQFDRSDLPVVMFELDQTADINQILRFFSYEHFYVLYCRFWELDADRDQMLELADLQNYSNGTITTSVLQRVVAGAGRKLTSNVPGKLDFEDFVYFCLAEEDKNSPAAIFYWFKVLDTDADGVISGYELGQFWEEQKPKLAEVGIEDVKMEDMLCQMLDMIGANRIKDHPQGLTLADLRSCPTPANFFNMIFNATKFARFEHRDPFGEHQMRQQPEKTDWDRFARLEYDRMASEVQQ